MTFGASIFLIAAGAILRYAVHLKIAGIDEHTIGLILMIAGVIGLIVATFQWVSWKSAVRRGDTRRY